MSSGETLKDLNFRSYFGTEPGLAAADDDGYLCMVIVGLARGAEIALSSVGLSSAQYRLLRSLQLNPSIPSDIADRLSVTRASVTAVVERLENRGYVVKRGDPKDGRRVLYTLTREGRAITRRASEAISSRLFRLHSHLNSKERAQALQGLVLYGQAIAKAWDAEDSWFDG